MTVVFVCLTDYSLQTGVIRLCRNFRDCFGGDLRRPLNLRDQFMFLGNRAQFLITVPIFSDRARH